MQRFFDPKKQQGKTVDIFAAKKTQIDLTSPDRNVSPFRGYKQAPSPSLAKNPDMSVSRGIFSSKKDTSRDEITPPARMNMMNNDTDRSMYSNYGQVFQEFLNNELRSQISQFRTEIVQMMNESFKDFREKAQKNQETLGAIKDSIKNNSHNIEKLDEKVEEYHSSLEMISTMFQSEIEKIKNNLPHSRGGHSKADAQQDQRFQKVESDLQEMLVNFDRLKDEITQGVQLTLEEYGQVSEQESNIKLEKVTGEISANMEHKIQEALEQINQKIASLEKHAQNQEDPNQEKLKFEMEEKLNDQIHALRQQVQSLYQIMEANARSGHSSPNKEGSPELDPRAELSRFEYENLKAELTAMVEHARSEGRGVSTRLEESEKKFGVELGQIREQIKAYQAENSSSAGLTQQTKDEFEKKIIIMEKRLDDIRQEQRDLNSNISIQKAQLESFKTTTAITMNDIKANQSQLEEVQLKKIDQTIEQLSKSIESLKTSASLNDSLSSTKISDSNRLENFHSFGHSGSASTHQEGQVRDRSGLDAYRSEQHSYEQGSVGYQRGLSGSNEPTDKEISPEKNATPEKKPSSDDFSSSYLPSGPSAGSGNKRDTLHPNKEFGQSDDKLGSGNKHDSGLGEPRPWEKLDVHKIDYSSPVKGDQNIQTITVPTSLPTPAERKSVEAEENEDEEVEVVYQLDENGFLMDEDGNYIYDDKGEMIKLNDDQLERLRENNLLEEEEENQ